MIEALAEGKYRSGNQLADEMGITRAAVWKIINELKKLGLNIDSVKGRGYRLNQSIEFLNHDQIVSLIPDDVELEILPSTDSTNSVLLRTAQTTNIHKRIVLAELQTQGKGRRGKTWVSPLATGIYLSLGWHFKHLVNNLSVLSLCVGVAVARCLKEHGIMQVGLKWPNDIYLDGKKNGGVLIEMKGEIEGPFSLVIGIGINVHENKMIECDDELNAVSIQQYKQQSVSRNHLTASLIKHVVEVIHEFEEGKSDSIMSEWRTYDCFINKRAILRSEKNSIEGTVQGVDNDGALLFQTGDKVDKYIVGELSLGISV